MSERPIRTSRSPLYWSHLKSYEDCPKQFLWSYGWEGVDLGSGLGNPKSIPEEKSEHHALLGSLVQRVLEDYANDSLWEKPLGLEDRLRGLTRKYFDLIRENYILTKDSPLHSDLIKEAFLGIQAFQKTSKAHGWMVPGIKSEVKLVSSLQGIPVGAKIDFVVPDGDSAILLDGKNTKYRMKYTDPDQLRFYHLVYELNKGKAPTKLGLVWFRFPYDAESGEQGVDWISCSSRDIQGLSDRIKRTYISMVKGEFPATPVAKKCNFCSFEAVCPERQAQKKENAIKKASKKKEVHLPMLGKGWYSPGD